MALPRTAVRPVALTADEALKTAVEIRRRQEEAARWLREDPGSYLATVERHDFQHRSSLTVGRDTASDVRIDDPAIAPRHLVVTVTGDSFHVSAVDPRTSFRIGDLERRDAQTGPGFVDLGRYRLRLSHQGYPAIVLMDRERLRSAGEVRRRYFPVDLSFRFVAPLVPAPREDRVTIRSTRGNERPAVLVGWFELDIDGTSCRVWATRLLEPGVGEEKYGLYFRDRTTGRETYPVGRYLDPERREDGTYLVDFNLAYNPACAFSPHYNCPIPSTENDLPVAIRAGEMTPHAAS